jgi:hypothetical protein
MLLRARENWCCLSGPPCKQIQPKYMCVYQVRRNAMQTAAMDQACETAAVEGADGHAQAEIQTLIKVSATCRQVQCQLNSYW